MKISFLYHDLHLFYNCVHFRLYFLKQFCTPFVLCLQKKIENTLFVCVLFLKPYIIQFWFRIDRSSSCLKKFSLYFHNSENDVERCLHVEMFLFFFLKKKQQKKLSVKNNLISYFRYESLYNLSHPKSIIRS